MGETIDIQKYRAQDWNTDRILGIYGGEVAYLESELLASHLRILIGSVPPGQGVNLSELVLKIVHDRDLQNHLEHIFAIQPRAISNLTELKDSVEQFYLGKKDQGLESTWSPYAIEPLLEAYASYGTVEMQLLLRVLAHPDSGGMGYRLERKKFSLSRWDIDHEKKVITLPEWYAGLLYTLTDSYGGKILRVNYKLAAELLKTAIHEEFLREESERSALHRGVGGALMVAGAVIGSFEAAPLVVIAVFIPQAIEGMTKIANLNDGMGINPARELLGQVGRFVGDKTGETIAKTGYEFLSLYLCFKGSVRIVKAPKTEDGIARAIEQASKEMVEADGNLLHEVGLAEKAKEGTLKPSLELSRQLFPGRSELFHQEFSQIKGQVRAMYGATSENIPIRESLAKTYSGARYVEILLEEPLAANRVWAPGTHAFETGGFWSLYKAEGSLQARIDQALLIEWAELVEKPWLTSQATRLSTMKVPAGNSIFFGEIGMQTGGFPGGASQLLIKGVPRPDWTIIHRELLR